MSGPASWRGVGGRWSRWGTEFLHGAGVPDAPGGHEAPALLDRDVDVVQAVDQHVAGPRPAADRSEVGCRGRCLGGRVQDHRAPELRPMTADTPDATLVLLTEQLYAALAPGDRLGEERFLLVEVRVGLEQPGEWDPDDEERDQQDPPSLQLGEERRLEIGIGGPWPHGDGDPGPLLRPSDPST